MPYNSSYTALFYFWNKMQILNKRVSVLENYQMDAIYDYVICNCAARHYYVSSLYDTDVRVTSNN